MKLLQYLATVSALCCFGRLEASEAITTYSGGSSYVGYTYGGTGFAFSPRADMVITALGYSGVDLTEEAYQVSLWDTNGVAFRTATLTTNNPLLNLTYYQEIPPVSLAAGVTYYLSAIATTNGLWNGNVIINPGNGTFSVAPDITYLAAASGTNGAGAFPAGLRDAGFYFIGANFQYQLRPEIVLTGISVSNALARISFQVTSNSASVFSLLSSTQPGGPWYTNQTAVLSTNEPAVRYTFSTAATNPAQFYRVQTP